MNWRRLRIGEWIVGGSGVLLLVSLFLPWWGIEGRWRGLGPGGPVEASYFDDSAPISTLTNFDAWQVFSVTDVLLALLGILAIVVCAVVARSPAAGVGLTAEALLTLLSIVMTIVVVIQILTTPDVLEVPAPIPNASLEIGAWLGLLATFGILFGLLAAMRDERLSKPGELTDATGAPTSEPVHVETLPAPPHA